jgi:hypothetical protein
MRILLVALLYFQTLQASPLLENEFVRVSRNMAPCAAAAPSCGDRVLLALGSIEVSGQKWSEVTLKFSKQVNATFLPRVENISKLSLSPGTPKRLPQTLEHLLRRTTRFCTMEKNSPFLRRKWSQASSVRVTATTNAWQFSSIERKCSNGRMGNRKPGSWFLIS